MYLVLLSLLRGAMGWSVICDGGLSWCIFFLRRLSYLGSVGFLFRYTLRAKKGPAPPLGNFADIYYFKENFKPHFLRDVCTLCSGALVSDSM